MQKESQQNLTAKFKIYIYKRWLSKCIDSNQFQIKVEI